MADRTPRQNGTGPQLLTVPQAMAALGLSRWEIYQAIWANRLRTVAIGRCRRIPIDALADYGALLRKETGP